MLIKLVAAFQFIHNCFIFNFFLSLSVLSFSIFHIFCTQNLVFIKLWSVFVTRVEIHCHIC